MQLLLILSANPVYTAPVDLGFAAAMKKVGTRIHLGHYVDETAALSNWHVPETHFLEAWSDARAFDGTATIVQPLIEPLYPDARSPHEILTLFGGRRGTGLLRPGPRLLARQGKAAILTRGGGTR